MKRIFKYKLFLENKENNNIDILDIISKLSYTYDFNNPQIYRGTKYESEKGSFIFKIRQTNRRNKGWLKFIDYLNSWIKFTKGIGRNRSIIATTNYNNANSWTFLSTKVNGEIYIIVPLKNDVYITPSNDFNFNDSWELPIKELREYYNSIRVDSTNNILEVIKHMISDIHYKVINDYYYFDDDYKRAFNDINNNIDELIEIYKDYEDDDRLKIFISRIKAFNGINKYLNYLFNPIHNGFKNIKYTELIKNIDEYQNNEVWFNCDCLFISEIDFKKIKNKLINK